jgi:hypothetical protein
LNKGYTSPLMQRAIAGKHRYGVAELSHDYPDTVLVICRKPSGRQVVEALTKEWRNRVSAAALVVKRAMPTQGATTRQSLIQTSWAMGWQDQKQKTSCRDPKS